MSNDVLLEVKSLKKYFPVRGGVFLRTVGYVHAVDDVSFYVTRGETVGVVGESGCGKTTLARCILMLTKPTSGEVIYDGHNLIKMSKKQLRNIRKEMSIIFQDPLSSLNPRMTVADIIGEPIEFHGIARGRQKRERIKELLEMVGLSPYHMYRYPHEFSGGQQQRIAIARALSTNPRFIIADEPVASLDVSIRAGILNLLKDLKRKFNLTCLFISHDLSVINYMCDRIMVMYLGKIVETAKSRDLFKDPLHPYTKALISSIPIPDPTVRRERIILPGTVPSPINPPSGCRFHPRCMHAFEKCKTMSPKLIEVKKDHFVACHLYA